MIIETVVEATDASAETTDGDRAESVRRGPFSGPSTPIGELSGADLTVLAALFLIPCAYLPLLVAWFWSARLIVLLAVAPAGLFALWRLVRERDHAARWATAALGWSLLAALLSGNVDASLRGWAGQDASVLSFAASIGLWALARAMSDRGRRLAAPVFLAAAGANLLVGALQIGLQIERGDLALLYGRAIGLTPNPVYFGALMAGATALCLAAASRSETSRLAPWHVGTFAFAVGIALSGSRVAMGALVLVGIYVGVRFDRRRTAFAASVAVMGLVSGSLFDRVVGQGRDSISRLGKDGSDGRFDYWRAGVEAVAERPVTGWGLGRFRVATQGRFTLEQSVDLDSAAPFFDAHNIVLGLVVAVGLPGLVLFAGFAWSSARSVHPMVAPAIAAIAITWLLQPVALTTLPVVVALMGVWAHGPSEETRGPLRWDRVRRSALVVAGLVPAVWLGVAEYRLHQAFDSGDLEATREAAELYLDDPVIANVVGHRADSYAAIDENARDEMFAAYRRSAELDPDRPHWWIELARREGAFGQPEAARVSAQRAIDLDPHNSLAWSVMRLVAVDLDDEALERNALDELCALAVDSACDDLAAIDGE